MNGNTLARTGSLSSPTRDPFWLLGGRDRIRTSLLGILIVGLLCGGDHPAAAAEPKAKVKKFENMTLTTKDGVLLACTYYPGQPSKQTVPIILVHNWDSNRGQMHALALGLQRFKHSVIVPDLRGHGQSVQRRNPATGGLITIDREDMKKADLESMVLDVEAAKSFLLEKHNEEELNIEQLLVVGDGVGAIVALNWAVMDWNARRLPAYKMGQDVKALILISPLQSFRGMKCLTALGHPIIRQRLPVMVMVGRNDATRYADAKRTYNAFERYHDKEAQDLFFIDSDTSLQGLQLIAAPGLENGTQILKFIDWVLVKRAGQYPWTDRTSPLK